MVIYKATNKVNEKVYIGQSKSLEQRKKEHFYDAKYGKTAFHKALKKYGFDNFDWEIIAECSTREEANILEKKFILEYGGVRSTELYNETEGGHSLKLRNFTDADRKRLSKKAKKQKLWLLGSAPENIAKSVETRKKTGVYSRLSERQKGEGNVSKIVEVQNKIANSVKKLWEDPEYRANQVRKQLESNPVVKCPYCEKEGRKQIMSRWHFDKCKYKQKNS